MEEAGRSSAKKRCYNLEKEMMKDKPRGHLPEPIRDEEEPGDPLLLISIFSGDSVEIREKWGGHGNSDGRMKGKDR